MRIGNVDVLPLRDAVGTLGGLDELFPETPLDAWEPYGPLYPEQFESGHWRLPCTCYLIRSAGRSLLVDTGPGNFEFFETTELRGRLLPALAEQGVQPADIETVLLTHIHVDHIGLNAAFGNARFLLHGDAAAAARERADRPHIQQGVLPLLEEERVDELKDGDEVAQGVVAVELPGHDPGHMGLRIGSEALLLGDAVPHAVLLDQTGWAFVADGDHARSVETRRAVVDQVLDTETLVIGGHYPGTGIGRVMSVDGRVVWREAP